MLQSMADASEREPAGGGEGGLPDLTLPKPTGEAYNAVCAAWSEGRLSPAQARVAVDLLKVRATVVAAEEFGRRLALAEAVAADAQRRALLGPAAGRTVDVESKGGADDGL
jgi:hypothetical protein